MGVRWRVGRSAAGHADAVFDSGTWFVPTWVEVGDLTPTGWELLDPVTFQWTGATGTLAFDFSLTFTFPAGASGNGWIVLTNVTQSTNVTGAVTASAPGDITFPLVDSLAFDTGDQLTIGLGGSFAQAGTAVSGTFP